MYVILIFFCILLYFCSAVLVSSDVFTAAIFQFTIFWVHWIQRQDFPLYPPTKLHVVSQEDHNLYLQVLSCISYMKASIFIVLYCGVLPKKPAYQRFIARQQLRKYVTVLEPLLGIGPRATMEVQLEAVFSMWSVPRLYHSIDRVPKSSVSSR
jgi:hypothetical protein